MANNYTDHPELRFEMNHPLMKRIVELKERGFAEKDAYDYAPIDFDDAMDNYDRVLDIVGEIAGTTIADNAEGVDLEGPHHVGDRVNYASGTDRNLDAMVKAGMNGMTMPRRYKGLNFPITPYTMCAELVAASDAGFGNIWSLQDCIETLYEFGDADQHARFIPRVCEGETMSMDLTEPDAGSDLQSVMLKATFDEENNCWRLNGVKRFITNGCGEVLLVLARTEEGTTDGRGLSCLLVEKGPWIKVRRLENKLGIHGSPTCEMVFTEAPAKLIGQRKRGLITYVMTLMNGARMGIAAQGVGIGEAAYRAARDYAASRKQFGATIDNLAPIREILATMSVECQAARALTYYAAKNVDLETGLTRKFEKMKGSPEAPAVRTRMKLVGSFNKMLTPMAKYYGSEMSMRNAMSAISVLGGSGYMKDYPVERYLRDSRITTIYEGTSQLQVVAAVAGVIGGLVKDVLVDIFGKADWQGEHPRMTALLADLDAAIEYAKGRADSHAYLELSARKLVDAGIALIVTALFHQMSIKVSEKGKALLHWMMTEFPRVRAGLEQVRSGYAGSVEDFETLAPAVPVMG